MTPLNPSHIDINAESDHYIAHIWQEADGRPWHARVLGLHSGYDSGRYGPYPTYDRAAMTAYAVALNQDARL
jgi:hypothetical protein